LFLFVLPCLAQGFSNDASNGASTAVNRYLVQIVLDGADNRGDCKQDGTLLFAELHLFHFPPGWRVAIVCNPLRWNQIVQQRDLDYRTRAFTNLDSRLTVLNVAIFHEFPSNYRHIIAHELSHVQCRCGDEKVAERIAGELEYAVKHEGNAQEVQRLAKKTPPDKTPSPDSGNEQVAAVSSLVSPH
jgi:hypothetical protein